MGRRTNSARRRFCAGDLAKITKAWNCLLEGRTVRVVRPYTESEWVVRLLGEPALSVSEDRQRFVVTGNVVADDWALEPLNNTPYCRENEATDSIAPAAHHHPEAVST